jgi:hypothetical protein
MSVNSLGRPQKAEKARRRQLQFSLYAEDIERLEALTDNRSEFIRQCIAQAWTEKQEGGKTVTIKLPRWLVREALTLLCERLPPNQAALVQNLIEQLLPAQES